MEAANANAINITIKTEADIKTEDEDVVRIVDVQSEILKGKDVRPGLLHEEESDSETDTKPTEMIDIAIQCDIEPSIPIDPQKSQTNGLLNNQIEETTHNPNAKALEKFKNGVKFVDPQSLNPDIVDKAVKKALVKQKNVKDSIIPLEKNLYLIPASYFGNALSSSSEEMSTINLPPVPQSELVTMPTLLAVNPCASPNFVDGKLHSVLKNPSDSGRLRTLQPKIILTPPESNCTNDNGSSLLQSLLIGTNNLNVNSPSSNIHIPAPEVSVSSTSRNVVTETNSTAAKPAVKTTTTKTANHISKTSSSNARRRLILTNPTLSGKTSLLKTTATVKSPNKTTTSARTKSVRKILPAGQPVTSSANEILPKIRVSKSLMAFDQPIASASNVTSSTSSNTEQSVKLTNQTLPVKTKEVPKIRVSSTLMPSDQPNTLSVNHVISSSGNDAGRFIKLTNQTLPTKTSKVPKISITRTLMPSGIPATAAASNINSPSCNDVEQHVQLTIKKLFFSKSLMTSDQPIVSAASNVANSSSYDVEQPGQVTIQKHFFSKSLMTSNLPTASSVSQIPICTGYTNRTLSAKTNVSSTNQMHFTKVDDVPKRCRTGRSGRPTTSFDSKSVELSNQKTLAKSVKPNYSLLRSNSASAINNMQRKMANKKAIQTRRPFQKFVDSEWFALQERFGFSGAELVRQEYKLHTINDVIKKEIQGISKLQQDMNVVSKILEERLKQRYNIKEVRITLDDNEVTNYFKTNNRLSELPLQIKRACRNADENATKKLKTYSGCRKPTNPVDQSPHVHLVNGKILPSFTSILTYNLDKRIDFNEPVTFINHLNFGKINYERLDGDPIIYLNTNTTITEMCLENFPLFRRAVQMSGVYIINALDFNRFIKASGHLYPNLKVPAPILRPEKSNNAEKRDKFKNFLFAGCKKLEVDVCYEHSYASIRQ